jgi:large subunit ribosomal protein L29
MKIQQLRELTRDELVHKHDELWTTLFGMRIKHALGQLENPLQLRATRREIARVKTLLRQQGVKEVVRPRRQTVAATRPAARESGGAAKKS